MFAFERRQPATIPRTSDTTTAQIKKYLHDNYCCAICGSCPRWQSRFASDFIEILGGEDALSGINMSRVVNDWVPLDQTIECHEDLIVIGTLFQHPPYYEHTSAFEPGKIYLLHPFKSLDWAGVISRNSNGRFRAFPGDKEASGLLEGTSKIIDSPRIRENKEKTIVVHRQCWQMMLGMNSLDYESAITPEMFWNGAFPAPSLSKMDILQDSEVKKGEMGFYPTFCQAPLKKDDGGYATFQMKAKEAIRFTMQYRKKDVAVEEELWQRVNAWIHHPIDKFPLKEVSFQQSWSLSARKKKEKVPNEKINANMKATAPSRLSTLPIEVLQEIVSVADIRTNVALSSTSKHMRNLIWDLMNRVAQVKVEKYDKWMMPILPAKKGEWEAKIKQMTLKAQKKYKSKEIRFPWAVYHKRCLESTCWSMKKRQLVWQNASVILKSLHKNALPVQVTD